MKNIDSIIDKACVEYCDQVDSVYNEKDVFRAGAHFALSLFKWRKVEEELPEVQEKQYQIAIRVIGSPSSASIWNIRGNFDLRIFDNLKGCEWKPIE